MKLEQMKYIIGILFFIVVSCTHNSNKEDKRKEVNMITTQNKNMNPDKLTPCEMAMQNIIECDFYTWNGLPEECNMEKIVGPLPESWENTPVRHLGSNFRETKWIVIQHAKYYRPSICYYNGKAVLFEAMVEEIKGNHEELIKSYGLPSAKLDWNFGTLPLSESEYVFPNRGITLFIDAEEMKVLYVALYQVTTLDNYIENLRPNLGKVIK